VSGIVVQPLAGAGGDRFGQQKTLIVVSAVAAGSLFMLPFTDTLVGLVVLTVVASGLLGATPLTQTYLVNHLPADMRGTGLGLLRTTYIGLGATSPLIVGVAADFGYFNGAFLGLAVAAAGAILLSRFIPDA